MERKEVETIIGTKIVYTEGKCKYTLLRNSETGTTESLGLFHSDAPLLAPQIIPDPHFKGFVWDFSKVMVLDDSDLDILTKNIEELRNFVKKIKYIRE
ncbi:MAG: hypothetical protein E6686_03530 [Lachnospiraceae bacterium]|nr:hypothetical protein [Lachnospiraceae bacterium]